MKNNVIRREVHPFEVNIPGDSVHTGKNTIRDIYITEIGYVMVSVYNEDRGVYVNYICKELKDILPKKIEIKEGGDLQSFEPPISKDDI
jgi:hypothetical protein